MTTVDYSALPQASRAYALAGFLESLAHDLRPIASDQRLAMIERFAAVAQELGDHIEAIEVRS